LTGGPLVSLQAFELSVFLYIPGVSARPKIIAESPESAASAARLSGLASAAMRQY
jgi:hypothetical protein